MSWSFAEDSYSIKFAPLAKMCALNEFQSSFIKFYPVFILFTSHMHLSSKQAKSTCRCLLKYSEAYLTTVRCRDKNDKPGRVQDVKVK